MNVIAFVDSAISLCNVRWNRKYGGTELRRKPVLLFFWKGPRKQIDRFNEGAAPLPHFEFPIAF